MFGRRQAALDAQEGINLEIVLRQRGELLAGCVESLQLAGTAELAQEPVGSAVSGDDPDPDARRSLALDQALEVVGCRIERREERAAKRRGLGDHGHVPRPQGDLALRPELLHPLIEQLGELHVAFDPLLLRGGFLGRLETRGPGG